MRTPPEFGEVRRLTALVLAGTGRTSRSPTLRFDSCTPPSPATLRALRLTDSLDGPRLPLICSLALSLVSSFTSCRCVDPRCSTERSSLLSARDAVSRLRQVEGGDSRGDASISRSAFSCASDAPLASLNYVPPPPAPYLACIAVRPRRLMKLDEARGRATQGVGDYGSSLRL